MHAHTHTQRGKITSIQQQLRAGENFSNMRTILVYLYYIYNGALADETTTTSHTTMCKADKTATLKYIRVYRTCLCCKQSLLHLPV